MAKFKKLVVRKDTLMLDFRSLTFLSVCKHMNFTKAAIELSLSQPAVSQHIRYLEDKYNCILFIRNKKDIQLTPEGKLLFSALKTISQDEKKIYEQIRHLSDDKGMLKNYSFGLSMTIGEYAITPAILKLVHENPETNFHIKYQNTETLLKCLDNGIIDFAVVEGYVNSDYYNVKKISSEEYIPVCSGKYKFSKPVGQLSDLLGERLIHREVGSGTLAMLISILAMQNISINDFGRTVEVNNMHMIVQLLKSSCGISFLYKSAVEPELKSGELVEIKLKDFKVVHDFSFIWNKNSIFSDEYEGIYNRINDFLNEMQ